MSTFDTDDFHTYGAVPVSVEYFGCGGEFCPGTWEERGDFTYPDDPPPCHLCTAQTRQVVQMYKPIGME